MRTSPVKVVSVMPRSAPLAYETRSFLPSRVAETGMPSVRATRVSAFLPSKRIFMTEAPLTTISFSRCERVMTRSLLSAQLTEVAAPSS